MLNNESSFLGKRKYDPNDLYLESELSTFGNDEWNYFSQSVGVDEDEDIFFSRSTEVNFLSPLEFVDQPARVWDLTECMISNIEPTPFNEEPVCSSDISQEASCPLVKLQLCSKFEKVWYSGRPFPAFSLEAVNDSTGERVDASGWKVMVSVYDGNGQLAGDKVCELIQNHLYEFHNGVVSILGVRFLNVSSKAGGHYSVAVHLVDSPIPEVTRSSIPFLSEKIQVLSYRLFLVPKVEIEALNPQDAISKMKGIGNLTSKRFAELGVKSIDQLAALDPEFLGEQGCSQLLSHLRKNRGSLTQAKLYEYISMAREIVDRSTQVSVVPSSPSEPNSPISKTLVPSCETIENFNVPAKRRCPSSDMELPLFPIGSQ